MARYFTLNAHYNPATPCIQTSRCPDRREKMQRVGETTWAKMTKINAELFSLTYGAMVTQLIRDFEDMKEVNRQLDQMGYNIGVRLIDEFSAKSGIRQCSNFKETADAIAKIGFKMFLGVNADITHWNTEFSACTLVIYDNPLVEFVELPPQVSGVLWYSNLLCGILKGALASLQMRVDVSFLKDSLQGDETTELRLTFKGMIEETMGDEYKE